MRFLVIGSNGQLAREFVRLLAARSLDHLAPAEADCDITSAASIGRVMGASRPDVVLNCAAYNLVDRAEHERDRAFLVNAEGPRILAEAAARHRARLVHFSSDYVFDGSKTSGPYVETDQPAPVNEYGRSKLAGEQAVREVGGDRALVLRLSWVFGDGPQNFIRKFLDRVASNEPLQATCDEFSVPTSTATIAAHTLAAVEQGLTGLFHLTNSGLCSRYEWARFILKAKGIDRFVRPVLMQSFRLPATRPGFSAMANTVLSRALGTTIITWEDAVASFLKQELRP